MTVDTQEKNEVDRTSLPENDPNYILNANFRCDKCYAQSYVRVTLVSGNELYFCAHHARKYEEALLAVTVKWYSEESRLIENKLVGTVNS